MRVRKSLRCLYRRVSINIWLVGCVAKGLIRRINDIKYLCNIITLIGHRRRYTQLPSLLSAMVEIFTLDWKNIRKKKRNIFHCKYG